MINAEDPEIRKVRGEDIEGTAKSTYFTFRAKLFGPTALQRVSAMKRPSVVSHPKPVTKKWGTILRIVPLIFQKTRLHQQPNAFENLERSPLHVGFQSLVNSRDRLAQMRSDFHRLHSRFRESAL